MQLDQQQVRIFKILFPYASNEHKKMVLNQGRLVHYTSAEAAFNMAQNNEIWMRNSSVVNDFMEIEHGISCFTSAYESPVGDKLRKSLDKLFPDSADELMKLFYDWIPDFRTDTYITSFSEHRASEDRLGRLSMWRAYGGATSVAVVLKSAPFLSPSHALKAYSSPVSYLDRDQFATELEKVVNNIEANRDFVLSFGRQDLINHIFWMVRFSVLCTKHPGFLEEKEWRVIYSPTFERSDRLIEDIQVITGVPQRIYKIPLKNVPEEGFVGAEIAELVDSVIIGPTQYPWAIYDACVRKLREAGMHDAASRVHVSDIPLRQ